MTFLIHWLDNRRGAMARSLDRGATLVEYALVFSLLVVVSLAALELLTESASKEINNQAVCVSDRPPPADDDVSCDFAPTPAELEFPDPHIVPPPLFPVDDKADLYTVTAGTPEEETEDTIWWVKLPVAVGVEIIEPPLPLEGAPGIAVRAQVRLNDTIEQFTECVTGDDGQCTLEFPVTQADVATVVMEIIDVRSDPPPDSLPSEVTFSR